MIEIRVQADEILFRLDQIPKRIRAALSGKYQDIIGEIRQQIQNTVPGKYLDPALLTSGTEIQGSLLIGYVEYTEKGGVYTIYPSKARVLRFLTKGGELVFAKRVLLHPYPKGGETIQSQLQKLKPWIFDQLEDAVIEAL